MSLLNKEGFSNKSNEVYFAARSPEDCAGVLLDKSRSFFDTLSSNSYLDKLIRMWRFYHGAFGDYVGYGHQVTFLGEQGELTGLPVNHFRNLAQHMINMICSNRPMMEARAVNTDFKSQAQTYLANGILDYYMREKHLEDALKKAVEMAVVMGAGYIKLDWNATAGEIYDFDEETNSFNYEGELEFSNLTPFDIVVDGVKESWNNDWMLVRGFKNRFDLIAKYPDLASKIKSLPTKSQSAIYRLSLFSNDDTDDIPVYEFFHRRTESMPDGRYMLFLASDICLLDTPLPYRVIPIFRIVPGEILGTPYGYSPMFDIYPIQEAINASYGTILTNQSAFGVQNVFVPTGSNLSVSTLEGGLNIVEGVTPPVPINLTQTPKEIFDFLQMLIAAAETISGINSVARGNPEASLKSGNALALVQSQALQFISGLQQSYVRLVEDVGTALIQILKDFALTPKTVALVGKYNRPLLKEFVGDDLSSINRVVVDMGNPLARTTAGRVQMADQLLQMKLLKSPEQYFQVMNTGRLDPVFEGTMSEILAIRAENEALMEGKMVKALAIERHRMHIDEHRSILIGPNKTEQDPMVIANTLNHIQEHIMLLRTTDPDLLQILGEQPLAPPMQLPPDGSLPPGPMAPPPGMPSPSSAAIEQTMQPQPGPNSQNQEMIQNQLGKTSLPEPAQVPGALLPNPGAQAEAMGNVK